MSPSDNRIDRTFSRLAAEGRCGLIPFVTAGDPSLAMTVPVLHALVEAGADLLELGMPFSDPMADGPVIQQSSERALARGACIASTLQAVADFRQRDATTPVVLMGYLNPVERFGCERFAKAAADAGVDGVLLVDLPPEEAGELSAAFSANGLALVALAAPTTADDRLAKLAAHTSGYLYYVSFAGVTGAGSLDVAAVAERLRALRAMTDVPVAVGFGIKTAADAAALAAVGDAIVVGSALVAALAKAAGTGSEASDLAAATTAATTLLGTLRAAVDGARGLA